MRGIGVPSNRLMVPSSRSSAMPMPRLTKVVEATPAAIMPAVNIWLAVMPVPSNSSEKIEPSSSNMMAGSENVNTTASRCRKNCFSSMIPRLTGALRSVAGKRLRGSAG